MEDKKMVNWKKYIIGSGVLALGIGLFFFEVTRLIAPALVGFGLGFLVS